MGLLVADPAAVPMSEVELTIRQGQQTYALATADAGAAVDNQLGQITWQVALPNELQPGPAILLAATARLPVTIHR